MDRIRLLEVLKGHAWRDGEFKRAPRGVPDSVCKAVSAFANTGGG